MLRMSTRPFEQFLSCCAASVAIYLGGMSSAHAQVAKIEVLPRRVNDCDRRRLLGGKEGRKGRPLWAGRTANPAARSCSLPAIVLIHGSAGVSGYIGDWEQFLNGLGVATFTSDSFAGRGIASTIDDQDRLGRLAMIVDAYRVYSICWRSTRASTRKGSRMGSRAWRRCPLRESP